VLLEDVEEGVVVLIGATTENPFFTVNTPLISRSQVFQFEPLGEAEIAGLLRRALTDRERGLGGQEIELTPEAAQHLARVADGDARRALTALEVAVRSQAAGAVSGATSGASTIESSAAETAPRRIVVDLAVAEESIQQKAIRYDAAGDVHYDVISAFIKSIRGSDPDAAVYWLARMLEGGEDPRFIARRLVIAAAEDIGNASPTGLVLAQAAADATMLVGMPECALPLAQATVYLATAEKSNAAAQALWSAQEDVRAKRTVLVPRKLRSSAYKGSKRLGHGEGYQYPHDFEGGVAEDGDLGVNKVYYTPTDRGAEAKIRAFLERVRNQRAAMGEASAGEMGDPEGPPSEEPWVGPQARPSSE
jgi:putative ATPase